MSLPTTPPRVMRGANGSVAGASGYPPIPAAADNVKYLKGDGTWSALSNASAATDAEASAGTSTTTFVTPANAGIAASKVSNSRAPRQGLAFNGTTSCTVANLPAFGTGDFSVAVWVMLNAIPTTFFGLLHGAASNCFGLRILAAGAIDTTLVGVSDNPSVAAGLTTGVWYLVGYTRAGTTGQYYVNGVALGATITDSRNYSAASNTIGPNLNGTQTPPIIENRTLSAAEMRTLFQSGAPASADYPSSPAGTVVTKTPLLGTWTGSVVGSTYTVSTSSSAFISGGLVTYGQLPRGKIRVNYDLTINSGAGPAFGDGNTFTSPFLVSGTGKTVEFTNTVIGNQLFLVNGFYAGNYVVTVNSITVIGLLLAPDAAQTGGGLTWYDTSGNAANITLPATGVTWNVPFAGYVTASASTALTLTGGSTGASLVLGNTNTGASLGGGGLAVGSSASFVVGATAGVSTNAVGVPQISASSNTYSSIGSIAHNTTNGNHGFFVAGKSRGTKASPTILADGDTFGEYSFAAYDGAAYRTSASIQAIISGTPGAGDLPTRLAFSVAADGSGSATERATLTSTGNLLIGTTTDAASLAGGLVVNGSGAGATASSTTTGALRVTGGVGVSGAGYFGSRLAMTGTASYSNIDSSLAHSSSYGFVMQARAGSVYDFALFSPGGTADVMRVPTGTNNVQFPGAVTASGQTSLDTAGAVSRALIVGPVAQSGGNLPYASIKTGIADFGLAVENTNAVSGQGLGLRIVAGATASDLPLYVRDRTNATTLFSVGGTGAATFAGAVSVSPTALTGVGQIASLFTPIYTSAATSNGRAIYAQSATAAAAFTLANAYTVYIDDTVKGAGSTITNNVALKINNQTAGTNNYAIQAGTGIATFADTTPATTTTSGALQVAGGAGFNKAIYVNQNAFIDGAAGTFRSAQFLTANVNRWGIGPNNTAESGANAGSDLIFNRWSDAGADLGPALTLTRSTGAATFAAAVTMGGNLTLPAAAAATTRYILSAANNDGTIVFQNGVGSSSAGGSLQLSGSTHATRPGWVTVGLGSGSTRKFTVSDSGTPGGTDVFTVDATGNSVFAGVVIKKNYTVATLPAAASYTYGEAYVSDATQAAGTSLGSAPTGGGSVKRGVYSDGSSWLLR